MAITFVLGIIVLYESFFIPGTSFLYPIADEFIKASGILFLFMRFLGIFRYFEMEAKGFWREKTKVRGWLHLWSLIICAIFLYLGYTLTLGDANYQRYFESFVGLADGTAYATLFFPQIIGMYRSCRIRSLDSLMLFIGGVAINLVYAPVWVYFFPIIGTSGLYWASEVFMKAGVRAATMGSVVVLIPITVRMLLGKEIGLTGMMEEGGEQ
jgi:hypothetical protein